MKNILKAELYKAIHSPGMKIAFLCGLILIILNAVQNALLMEELFYAWLEPMVLPDGRVRCYANATATSVYYNWIGVNSPNIANLIFYPVFPLLAAMPCAGSALEERKDGYADLILVRTGKRKYLTAKFFANFFVGGIAVAFTAAADFLLSAVILPMTPPAITHLVSTMDETQFGSWIYYQHPNLFVLADIFMIFLWGGVMASLALGIGQLVRKKIFALFFPFCLCILIEAVFVTNILVTYLEWSPIQIFHMATIRGTSGAIIFGEILAFLFLSAFLFFMKGVRDEGL